MSDVVLWFFADLLVLGLFVILLCAALEWLDKKTRMKFEKKENEGDIPDNSEGS